VCSLALSSSFSSLSQRQGRVRNEFCFLIAFQCLYLQPSPSIPPSRKARAQRAIGSTTAEGKTFADLSTDRFWWQWADGWTRWSQWPLPNSTILWFWGHHGRRMIQTPLCNSIWSPKFSWQPIPQLSPTATAPQTHWTTRKSHLDCAILLSCPWGISWDFASPRDWGQSQQRSRPVLRAPAQASLQAYSFTVVWGLKVSYQLLISCLYVTTITKHAKISLRKSNRLCSCRSWTVCLWGQNTDFGWFWEVSCLGGFIYIWCILMQNGQKWDASEQSQSRAVLQVRPSLGSVVGCAHHPLFKITPHVSFHPTKHLGAYLRVKEYKRRKHKAVK